CARLSDSGFDYW
nr:immunoglobulin heavy chain junction region [Macaca mulatta]MOY21911.1 immunoglobulin heavy chain junction region [Macaca mulatta]MOY22114.1 immunoglobulin heavy chain junction region [Macaca mulatta]MOY22686.1 immunoglobulin heavy chain junction region [Macaca mulatta]MOY23309.1 immunoglobulin heavy chain junction region [Macaca mulatta]